MWNSWNKVRKWILISQRSVSCQRTPPLPPPGASGRLRANYKCCFKPRRIISLILHQSITALITFQQETWSKNKKWSPFQPFILILVDYDSIMRIKTKWNTVDVFSLSFKSPALVQFTFLLISFKEQICFALFSHPPRRLCFHPRPFVSKITQRLHGRVSIQRDGTTKSLRLFSTLLNTVKMDVD